MAEDTEVKYKFRELKVYCSTEWLADNRKKYRQVFGRYETAYIYAELSFYNKWFDREDWEVNVELKCYTLKEGEKEICSLPFQRKVGKYDHIFYIREGWGNENEGAFWKKGTYYWEAWVEGEKVATKYFYVEDIGSKALPGENPYFEVKSLKLYEGPYDDVEVEKRVYFKTFDHSETRYIYTEINLANLFRDEPWQLELFAKFYNDARELKGQVVRLQRIEKGDERITITAGWGSNVKGSWRKDRYTVEIVFMDKLLAVLPFEVKDEFEEADESDFESYTNGGQEKKWNIKVLKIPESLQTGFQQYFLFFREYVSIAKGIDIQFDVKKVDEGLELEILNEEDYEVVQEYFEEYLSFVKENFIGIINVEGDPSPESIDILRIRLEQQIHNLNLELKFKELQVHSLQEHVKDIKKEKSQLLEMVHEALNQKVNKETRLLGSTTGGDDIKSHCRRLVSEDKINLTINTLAEFAENNLSPSQQKDIILIKNRWTSLNRGFIRNQVPNSEASIQRSNIVSAILDFIEMM